MKFHTKSQNRSWDIGSQKLPELLKECFMIEGVLLCFIILWSILIFCMKLHSLVLWNQEYMSVNFHDFWRCFDMLTRGAKLGSEALLQQFGQFLRVDISRSVLRFCMKLHSLILWSQECMSVNFHVFWRCFGMLIRGAKLDKKFPKKHYFPNSKL